MKAQRNRHKVGAAGTWDRCVSSGSEVGFTPRPHRGPAPPRPRPTPRAAPHAWVPSRISASALPPPGCCGVAGALIHSAEAGCSVPSGVRPEALWVGRGPRGAGAAAPPGPGGADDGGAGPPGRRNPPSEARARQPRGGRPRGGEAPAVGSRWSPVLRISAARSSRGPPAEGPAAPLPPWGLVTPGRAGRGGRHTTVRPRSRAWW